MDNKTHLPSIRTQTDLHALWTTLMEPLGFSGTSLWFAPLAPDGHPLGQVTEVADLPSDPPDRLDALVGLITAAYGDAGDLSVAFLLSRPGRSAISADDARWAQGLAEAAHRAALRIWPVHLASNESVVVIPPDAIADAV